MTINPLAGKPAPADILVNIPALISAYYANTPDVEIPAQKVSFGTSGHRGSSFNSSFNEAHILATTQSICLYRKEKGTDGPLFMGMDTHALSTPAFISALEVLAANEVDVMIGNRDEYTPTPAISHAILQYNRERTTGLADGIVITPSHNPPTDGGFKYNPTNGGPAGTDATSWIEKKANDILRNNLQEVKRMPYERALKASTTHIHDYINTYVADLVHVIDFDAIRNAGLRIGVDPLGGAGVAYWQPIADAYKIDMTVLNKYVDPTFRFMSVDWDGQIRMDPSSSYAMQGLIGMKDSYDIAFACDTDHDRHGIVTPTQGLMQPNHFLAVCIDYLFSNRPSWNNDVAVGKTLVSSSIIDKVTARAKRNLYEVPVGFKWFVDGLIDGKLGFVGEESAGATFLRKDGGVWTTDKDGFIPALLSAEITAVTGKDPAQHYHALTEAFGAPLYDRIEAPANAQQKALLGKLSPEQVTTKEMAGDPITRVLTKAPGNDAAIGGLKVETANGWFAARPSGTEDIYKIYGESFKGKEHLTQIQQQAQEIVNAALKG